MRRVLEALVVALLVVLGVAAVPTTAASEATYGYDATPNTRVGVTRLEGANARSAQPSGVRDQSVSPVAPVGGASTTFPGPLNATEAVDIAGANFAQTTASRTFSSGGTFAGQSIDDVAGALRSGAMSAKDVPVQVIVRDGNTLILNTRSALALEQAGVPRSAWNVVNVTGDPAAQARLAGQLARNGLDSTGTSSVRITGAG